MDRDRSSSGLRWRKPGALGFTWASRSLDDRPDVGNKKRIIIHHPLAFESLFMPACAAYYHRLLPEGFRVLATACIGFDAAARRQNAGSSIARFEFFSRDATGTVDITHALNNCDRLLLKNP